MLVLVSSVLSDTPKELLHRNENAKALEILKRLRGVTDFKNEFQEICTEIENDKEAEPLQGILHIHSRPKLVISTVAVVSLKLLRIGSLVFFGPLILKSLQFEVQVSYVVPLCAGLFGMICTVLSTYLVQLVGLRKSLMAASGTYDWVDAEYPRPSKALGGVYKLGLSIFMTIITNAITLPLMCWIKAPIFFTYATIALLVGCFIGICIPETRGIPEEDLTRLVWGEHWLWKRYKLDPPAL
ncbi:hypothetical protein RJ639_024389 [Escallonia herrerae]|uniref:Uncharacterized protein n=1 Tax=Escallonia herrerae TaxID=1293975 RepID=A0AA88V1R5_9ASTE|nr:hypothetical protein RJ639_024389 [Escallonia herrerae]